jgi:peptidylprolyl isomerase
LFALAARALAQQPQATITHRVFFDMTIGGVDAGRITFGLYGDVVPRTVQNFMHLCMGDRHTSTGRTLSYAGSSFHRIIPRFMIQGGDFTRGNGMGGESIFGLPFADENFALKHTAAGILSMANRGPGTNGSQFFITSKATPWLDGHHVVFGIVVEGMELVRRIETMGSSTGKPKSVIKIAAAGLLPSHAGLLR